jgi:hypothetical protein
MKFADALHRLDTFPTVGRGKHKYVESKRVFTHGPCSPTIAALGVRILAHYKQRGSPGWHGPLTIGEGIIDPAKLVPTQNGIYRKKVQKDIEENRLSEPIIVWRYRSKFYILDGHHRAATALLVGADQMPAIFLYGTRKPRPAGVV